MWILQTNDFLSILKKPNQLINLTILNPNGSSTTTLKKPNLNLPQEALRATEIPSAKTRQRDKRRRADLSCPRFKAL